MLSTIITEQNSETTDDSADIAIASSSHCFAAEATWANGDPGPKKSHQQVYLSRFPMQHKISLEVAFSGTIDNEDRTAHIK